MLIQCYLWLITARAHCWLMSNLLSTKIPRTFYARFCLLFGFFYPEDSWPAIHLYPHILSISHQNQKARVVVAAPWRGSQGPFPFSFLLSLLPLLPLQDNTQKPPNKTRPGQPITLFQPLFANKGLTVQLSIWPVTFVEC